MLHKAGLHKAVPAAQQAETDKSTNVGNSIGKYWKEIVLDPGRTTQRTGKHKQPGPQILI